MCSPLKSAQIRLRVARTGAQLARTYSRSDRRSSLHPVSDELELTPVEPGELVATPVEPDELTLEPVEPTELVLARDVFPR